MEYVDVFGMIDPIYVPDRRVRYFVRYRSFKSATTLSHNEAYTWAEAIAAEHGTLVVDCSDRGMGLLQAQLDASRF